MKALLILMAGLAVAGCGGSPSPWPDRPWVDAGCEAPGLCRVRGQLEIVRGVPHSGGKLTLDDGRCLPVALPPEVIRRHDRWDGHRVAIRARAMARGNEAIDIVSTQYSDRFLPSGLCPAGELVLYADRLSLKGAQ